MASWTARTAGCALALSGLLVPGSGARAQLVQVQITGLSDVTFGQVSSVSAALSSSQTVCVYSTLQRYTIKASGSGPSSAFTLAKVGNGAVQMAYTVQWSFSGQQTTGTQLMPGQGLTSPVGINILCSLGSLLANSASLTVTLPAASLSAAQAGTYTGTLSLMVSPN